MLIFSIWARLTVAFQSRTFLPGPVTPRLPGRLLVHAEDPAGEQRGQHDRRMFVGRSFLGIYGLLTRPPASLAEVNASEDDMTSKFYNPDGSIKDDVEKEAKFREVQIMWDTKDDTMVNIDGINSEGTNPGKSLKITYKLPLKWADGQNGGDRLYFDRSEGVNAIACDRITVYQAPGNVGIDQLQKAPTIGVSKALRVTADIANISDADLIGGRTRSVDGQKYYDFDMAVAPKTCGSSQDNLGLGFCPFDSIYLLSATIVNDKLFVFIIQSDKEEWKRANSDIKVVRSTFKIEKQ